MYRVLKPEYEQTGERLPDGRPVWRVKEWVDLGRADSMEDAKRLHAAPVLEPWKPHRVH
jgi:hypothetical protein